MFNGIFPFIPLLLFCLPPLTSADCPKTPKSCKCVNAGNAIRLTCAGDFDIDAVAKGFATLTMESLEIAHCPHEDILSTPWPKLSVRSLSVTNCSIRVFHEKALDSLADTLERLILSNNSIKIIPFFGNLKKLQSLDLSWNALDNVGERSLEGLDRLKHLRLAHNRICSLSTNSLTEIKATIESLELSHNCFGSVPAQNIRNSLKLIRLDLSGNQISEIPRLQFMNLPSLRELSLDVNRIAKLSPMAFLNVPQLSHLSLRHNVIAELDAGCLQAFHSLQVIDLSGNTLTQMPSFKELPYLTHVRIDSNKIRRIDTLTFGGNPKLQLISAQMNEISLIAKNSFDSLDQLGVLLLSNNSLQTVERSMFDGMRNLKELHLENNSIREVLESSFTSIPLLNVLDLSNNQLQKIKKGTFTHTQHLYWLDLSSNAISTFEANAFQKGIANILLDGNPLNCDDSIDWFLSYLVRNQVRTFLPQQPDVTCASPKEKNGTRVKELMMQKANESRALEPPPQTGAQRPGGLISSLLPYFTGTNELPTNAGFPTGQYGGVAPQPNGNRPVDVSNAVRSMKSFVVQVPGYGPIDISKLPPQVIEHVANGGQIPGIPPETLSAMVRQLRAQLSQPTTQPYAGPTNERPQLPQESIPSYSIPTPLQPIATNATFALSPMVLQMMKLIPPGYNLSRLPPEVMQSVMRGELPDLSLLPPDLLMYLRDNVDSLVGMASSMPNVTIDDILRKLPKFEQPKLATFSPYDIGDIDSQLIVKESEEIHRTRLYTAIALGIVGAITLAILAMFCAYVKRERRLAAVGTTGIVKERQDESFTHMARPVKSTIAKKNPSSSTATLRCYGPSGSSLEEGIYQRPFPSEDRFYYAPS